MRRLILILFSLFLGSYLYGQRPDFSGTASTSSRGSSGPAFASNTDTISRPPLVYGVYLLDDLSRKTLGNDTSLASIPRLLVEHDRRPLLFSLGSPLSYNTSPLLIQRKDLGIHLGQSGYDVYLKDQSLNQLVDANRGFFGLKYDRSFNLESNNIGADFARRFARNILLNFHFDIVEDKGWLNNSVITGSRMDIKFAQQSKHQNRLTIVQYQSGDISENTGRTLLDPSANSQLNSSLTKVSLYNWMQLDSMGVRTLSSELKTESHRFNFVNSTISPSESDHFGLYFSTSDSIGYFNQLIKTRFYNRLNQKYANSELTAGLGLNLLNWSQYNLNRNFLEINTDLSWKHKRIVMLASIEASKLGWGSKISSIYSKPIGLSTFEGQLTFHRSMVPLSYRQINYNNVQGMELVLPATQSISVEGSLLTLKESLRLRVQGALFNNFVMWDPIIGYDILANTITYIRLDAHANHHVGKFSWSHDLLLQNDFSGQINLSQLIYKGDVHTEFKIFKKRMKMRLGVDVTAIPDFKLATFQPILGDFYSELSASRSGNIILLRPYASFKVDEFYAFVKVDNALSRLSDSRNFIFEGYPQQDFRIRVGVKWVLLD